MANCQHPRFRADCDITRLEDVGRFTLDVRVQCIECGTPFQFLGLPAGVRFNGAAVSVDGLEGRFAIAPRGMQPSPMTPPGATLQ